MQVFHEPLDAVAFCLQVMPLQQLPQVSKPGCGMGTGCWDHVKCFVMCHMLA